MLTIDESNGAKYPFRVVITHPVLRKQGFAYWHREKDHSDCGLNDALDATTLYFSNRTDAERLVHNITSDLASSDFRPARSA